MENWYNGIFEQECQNPMKKTDTQLMQAIGNGDRQAFEALVRRYQNPLFSFIRKYMGGERQQAEDLTQEVFLRVYRAASRFEVRSDSSVSAWIFTIAYNLSMNEARRCRRQRDFTKELCEEHSFSACESATPEETYHLKNTVFSALEELPEKQRAALLLRVTEGLSYTEISEVLHISVPGVESLIYRARKSLREKFPQKE